MKTAHTHPEPFEIVETYAKLGPHRTGDASNHAVTQWVHRILHAQGAKTDLMGFPFSHFQSTVQVIGLDKPVATDMLYYCWAGERTVASPLFGDVDAHASEEKISARISELARRAAARGHDGLVLATQNPAGEICGINREMQEVGNLPIILVPPIACGNLKSSNIAFDCQATVFPDHACNIRARFPGPGNRPPVVITTPISGWYGCAGERGAGLAVALSVATRLADEFTVDLLLARGHELGFAGGYHLSSNYSETPLAVLHIGSCVANITARASSWCSAAPEQFQCVAEALSPVVDETIRPEVADCRKNWVGEAQCWASNAYPMLSVAGQSPEFHTPADVARTATTPDLLKQTISLVLRAVNGMLS